MHLRKGHEQQVHRIQHQLDAHEDNDRIASRQHSGDADAKKGDGKEYVIVYRHVLGCKPQASSCKPDLFNFFNLSIQFIILYSTAACSLKLAACSYSFFPIT